MIPQHYALIAGHGRSGTNWLLSLLDASPTTYCRNDPDVYPDSPLAALSTQGEVFSCDQDRLRNAWPGAVEWAATHMGTADLLSTQRKAYVRSSAYYAGLYRMIQGPRYRRMLALAFPALRRDEWPLPGWIVDKKRFPDALVVIKVNQVPGWFRLVARDRPDTPVIHIVRHPAGFLNSFLRRFVAHTDRTLATETSRARWRRILENEPAWRETVGDPEERSLEELELYYWRYANEHIHELRDTLERYRLVVYEELVRDAPAIMQGIYRELGLAWDRDVESRIEGLSRSSGQPATGWRATLDEHLQQMSQEVLTGSSLAGCWR